MGRRSPFGAHTALAQYSQDERTGVPTINGNRAYESGRYDPQAAVSLRQIISGNVQGPQRDSCDGTVALTLRHPPKRVAREP